MNAAEHFDWAVGRAMEYVASGGGVVTAVSSTVVRYGRQSVYTADWQYVETREPDIWAHVIRTGWTVYWEITAGKTGELLAYGRTWTKGGARWKAFAAAQRPGILGGAR